MKDNSVQSRTIEWLRFFCAVFIVVAHTTRRFFPYGDFIYKSVADSFCQMVVPLFFIISGYLLFFGLEQWDTAVWKRKMKKRVHTLLIPYLIWNFFAILLHIAVLYYRSTRLGEATDLQSWASPVKWLMAFWADPGLPANNPLWFMRNLIVLNLISPLIYFLMKHKGWIWLTIIYGLYLAGIWFWLPGFEPIGIFFFSLGAYLKISGYDMTVLARKVTVPAVILAIASLVCMVEFYYTDHFEFFKTLYRLFGSVATVAVASTFIDRGMKVRPALSESTFFLYAVHYCFILPVVVVLMNKCFPQEQYVFAVIRFLLAVAVTVGVSEGLYFLLKRIMPKTLGFLTGRK